MSYPSIDKLQQTLSDTVFSYAGDRKKAAGRALGTLVELITFYTLRAWGFRDSIAIERSLPEFANGAITHNVEFSLHPILETASIVLPSIDLPLTPSRLRKHVPTLDAALKLGPGKNHQLLSRKSVLRNACVLFEDARGPYIAHLDLWNAAKTEVSFSHLHRHPFAIFECKRVGVEEGMRKGPQTIEKAKQGAYVARSVSALQKIRRHSGEFDGVIEIGGKLSTGPYAALLADIVEGTDREMLANFILTVGVVSNHGNWFTSTNQNKELKVLAQSYDWLLFLTDHGLAKFVDSLLLNPSAALAPARSAFESSYLGNGGKNSFTKVQIDIEADRSLKQYFVDNEKDVESWFNVISPSSGELKSLRAMLQSLQNKPWKEILSQ